MRVFSDVMIDLDKVEGIKFISNNTVSEIEFYFTNREAPVVASYNNDDDYNDDSEFLTTYLR